MSYPDNPEVVSSYSFQIYAFTLSVFLPVRGKEVEHNMIDRYVDRRWSHAELTDIFQYSK